MSDILTPKEVRTLRIWYSAGPADISELNLIATIDALAEALRAADDGAQYAYGGMDWDDGESLTRYEATRARVAAWLEADDGG